MGHSVCYMLCMKTVLEVRLPYDPFCPSVSRLVGWLVCWLVGRSAIISEHFLFVFKCRRAYITDLTLGFHDIHSGFYIGQVQTFATGNEIGEFWVWYSIDLNIQYHNQMISILRNMHPHIDQMKPKSFDSKEASVLY